jgi:hypothetical protein
LAPVKLEACIRQMLGSNLDQNTGYPGWGVCSHSLQANDAIGPRLGSDWFLLNPFNFVIYPFSRRYIGQVYVLIAT